MDHYQIFIEFQKIHQSSDPEAIKAFYKTHLLSKNSEKKESLESKNSEPASTSFDFTQLIQQYSASTPPYANKTLDYNEKVYQDLVRYFRFWHAKEQNGIPEEQAYKLSVFFNSTEDALKYLTTYSQSQKDKDQPHIHDACLFALPQAECDLTIWRALSKKLFNEKPFRDMLAQAPDIELLIKRLPNKQLSQNSNSRSRPNLRRFNKTESKRSVKIQN